MQNAQNILSSLPGQNFYGQANASQGGFSAKTSSRTEEAGSHEANLFTSFWALLTQTAAQTNSGENLEASLDLTFSAEQGENREEYSTILSLTETLDTSAFPESIVDLLASLRSDLEKKGVDIHALSEQVDKALDGNLSEVLSDLDIDRLKAALSRLQNAYPTLLESNGPRHLDIEVAVSDNLKLGLEASLNANASKYMQKRTDMIPVAGSDGETTSEIESSQAGLVPVPQDLAQATGEANDPEQILAVSRLYAYLKTDVSKADSPKTVSDTEASAERRDDRKEAAEASSSSSTYLQEHAVPVLLASSEQNGSQEKDASAEQRENGNIPSPSNRMRKTDESVADAVAGRDEALQKGNDSKVKTDATEHRSENFEQFFEGILSRRQFDARTEVMEMTRGTSPTRSDSLREGLDNVVRFIRTSGEQRASLIVDPPALGRISVELTNGTSGLEASIKVSSEQVRQLVQDQLTQLRMSLAQQGVQLTHFSVDVQQDNGRHHQEFERQGRQTRAIPGQEDGEDAQDEQIFRVDLNQGLLYWVA